MLPEYQCLTSIPGINIEQLLEIEAILSEIQFYLEEINLESADTNNVISQIETEYLVDYYYKIITKVSLK